MSRVDVIIPCYKYAHFLEGCVDSVLTQGVDARVLIIDDCSPDDTPKVSAKIAAADSRVEYRRHEVNKRHIATYNEGLEWTSGEYTLLLSADDLLAPSSLKRAVEILDANPEVGLLHGDCRDFETVPPLHEATESLDVPFVVQRGEEYVAEAATHGYNQVHTPTAITRTSLQHRIGGYRADLPHSADMEMWLRFAAYSDIVRVDAVQAFYRVHGQNMHFALASTTLADLEHRKLTWDLYFREHGAAFPDLELLQDTANESLARDALGEAFKAFGEGDTGACRSFITLAKQAYPACRDWRLYGRLQWMLRAGPAAWGLMRKVMGRSPENAAANSAMPTASVDQSPNVSVVIATHNYAAFLPQAIAGVRAQTVKDWECLIVDDGSTDETPEICARVCAEDGRFRYLRNDPNRGEAGTRNIGNREARGTWIATLDADDWWHPNKLKKQLAAAQANPEAVLLFTAKIDLSDEGEREVRCPPEWLSAPEFTLRQESLITHSSTLIRRDALKALDGYDETLPTAPDWDLWLRLLERHGPDSLVYVDDPLVFYRLHGSNISRNWGKMRRAEWQIIRRHVFGNGWWRRHPREAVQAVDEQLWREVRRHQEKGNHSAACRLSLVRAMLTPTRIWRWRRLLESVATPPPASTPRAA